jgi:hypothetical protein
MMRRPVDHMMGAVRAAITLAVAFAVVVAVGGCDGAERQRFKDKFTHYSDDANYRIATKGEDGDARRRAIVRIGQGRRYASDEAFAVLDRAARYDPNSQVRCAALRVFTRYWDARPLGAGLAILDPQTYPDGAREATAPVHWDATALLCEMVEGGLVPDEKHGEVANLLARLLLDDDECREVHIYAARALGSIPNERVLRPLIASLRHKDFGIAYEAERSLHKLTGQLYGFDAAAWEAWLTETDDPFSRTIAGETAVENETQPAGS